jgi:hypothetical protein
LQIHKAFGCKTFLGNFIFKDKQIVDRTGFRIVNAKGCGFLNAESE